MQLAPAPEETLASLQLSPGDVSSLPAKARTALIGYLLRWGAAELAGRCLEQLLETHGHLVSIRDSLARAYLDLGQADRAVEVMHLRHRLSVSNRSQALAARAHLAAGDLESAQAIARMLVEEQPEMLLTWSLLADVCIAAGDFEGAQGALQRREDLSPEAAATAHAQARFWLEQRQFEKALLWGQTSLARYERDQRHPPLRLLRLLEELYRLTGQSAQADATASRLARRHLREWQELCDRVGPVTAPTTAPVSAPPADLNAGAQATPTGWSRDVTGEVSLAGAVTLTAGERNLLDQALRTHFPHDSFRPGQPDVIAAILRGESVLAVMPTGAGKSLCYQLASLLLPGTTLVISPLIALMKDQLDGLPEGVARLSTTLNSSLDGQELDARLRRAARGQFKLVYAAPERLRQRPFLHTLAKAGVSLIVVDEAHCVSLWGHDFRPDYLFISKAWLELGRPPVMAMTATATARVRDDINAALCPMRLVATDVHRPNLRFEVHRYDNSEQKMRAIVDLCKTTKGSGIVYANSRRKCEELAGLLQRNGVSAIHYHAGIENRAAAQDLFMHDRARVVVATIAFGMGVDKADVRFIVHYDPPKTLENYYQEAGRAGRDGLPARCILFHTPSGKGLLTRWTRQDALHIDFLRQVYAAVRARVALNRIGLVAAGDLERDLQADETHIRVAIHFLERAGLLWRGFDLPRTACLTLSAGRVPTDAHPDRGPVSGASQQDAEFVQYVEAARLVPHQTVTRDLVGTCRSAGLDPRAIEASLLAWHDAGLLRYRGIGRDMLLAIPEPPSDSQERVLAMLAEHRAGQDNRLADLFAYAETESCRHGNISRYFGGRHLERCDACDNCIGRSAQVHRPTERRPAPADPAFTIIKAIGRLPHPMGKPALGKMLKGSIACSVPAQRSPDFGALEALSMTAIGKLVDLLVDHGAVSFYTKDKYRLLRLSSEGQRLILRSGEMPNLTRGLQPSRPPPGSDAPLPAASPSSELADVDPDIDNLLYERLHCWRSEASSKLKIPPYMVFHNAVLRRVATHPPTTLAGLLAIKGIGPRKIEQFGTDLLAIVTEHETASSREEA